MSEDERTPGGTRILRHGADAAVDRKPVACDAETQAKIEAHIERHLGPAQMVFHEIVSEIVHLDVHHVAPTPERNWHTFVTTGMSARPMNVPDGFEDFRHAELLICVPPDWPVSEKGFEQEDNYWPLRWLKSMARLPHEYDTWLCHGHTIPNGDPPNAYADNTSFCCMLVTFPVTAGEEFLRLSIDKDRSIVFWALVPITLAEMEFKLQSGTEALEDRFDDIELTEVLDLNRDTVA